MAKICLSLTGKTIAEDIELLDKNRKYADAAELRVDCLDPDERFLIRRFPEMAGLPVILTIRREIDGGNYTGAEGSRIKIFADGLAYADADRRRNFAYVDLEDDLDIPSLEEAARTFGTRIIRSRYNMDGVDDDLAGILRQMRRVGDELVKAVITPHTLNDVIKVYRAARETMDIEKIITCMGEYGGLTGILAEFMGSRFCYASAGMEPPDGSAATGQLKPGDLVQFYRFRKITGKTKIFAVAGFPLITAASPRFFNTVFESEKADAVFVSVTAGSVHDLMRFAKEIGLSGITVTVPYKEEILPYLKFKSPEVITTGACNIVVADTEQTIGNDRMPGRVSHPGEWRGYNTDAACFSASLLSFLGRKDLRGRRLTIVGAGGTARSAAAEIYRLKGNALILNRTSSKARSLASQYRFAWAGLDSHGADLMSRYSDIIIQASSAGMEPHQNEDPLEFYRFTGRETVMDLIYKPEMTRCLKRAEEAGCRILNGYDMLTRQARMQYGYFMNKEFPPSLVSRIKF